MVANERLARLRELFHDEPTPQTVQTIRAMIDAWPHREDLSVGQDYVREHLGGLLVRMVERGASPQTWGALLEVLLPWKDQTAIRKILPRLEAALEAWPDALRRAPLLWPTKSGPVQTQPWWSLVRTVRAEPGLRPKDSFWRHPRFKGVRCLDLSAPEVYFGAREARVIAGSAHFSALNQIICGPNRVRLVDLDPLFTHFDLRALTLTGTSLSPANLQFLMDRPRFKSLQRLDLERCGLTREAGAILMDAEHLGGLEVLGLASNRLEDDGVQGIVAVRGLERLRSLDLRCNGLTAETGVLLGRSNLARQLRSLNLRTNPLGDRGALALLEGPLPALEALNLGSTGAGDTAAMAIARRGLARLSRLVLRDNDIGDRGAWALADASALAGLRVLNLRANRLGPDGARSLADSSHLTGLAHLSLRSNPIGDEGARALAASPILSGLRALDLSSTGLTDTGMAHLARSPTLGAIEALHLRGNNISQKGIQAWIDAGRMGVLRGLDLRGNAVDDEAAKTLAAASEAHRLRWLNLRENFLTEAGIKALCASKNLQGLEVLNLQRNYIRDTHSRQLTKGSKAAVRLFPSRQ